MSDKIHDGLLEIAKRIVDQHLIQPRFVVDLARGYLDLRAKAEACDSKCRCLIDYGDLESNETMSAALEAFDAIRACLVRGGK